MSELDHGHLKTVIRLTGLEKLTRDTYTEARGGLTAHHVLLPLHQQSVFGPTGAVQELGKSGGEELGVCRVLIAEVFLHVLQVVQVPRVYAVDYVLLLSQSFVYHLQLVEVSRKIEVLQKQINFLACKRSSPLHCLSAGRFVLTLGRKVQGIIFVPL